MELIRIEAFDTTKWSGGITKQICIYPENSIFSNHDFVYRVSSANVELEKSNFTRFQDYTRYILSLDNSLKIFHNNQAVDIYPLQTHKFSGNDETVSYGKCSDFNLIIKKDLHGSMGIISDKTQEIRCGHTIVYAYNSNVLIEINSNKEIIKINNALLIKSSKPITIKALENRAVFANIEL